MSDKQKAPNGVATDKVSRRRFLKGSAAVGVGGAAVMAGFRPNEAEAQEMQWEAEADVVVVGGGCSGLSAAIAARDSGASVLVIEPHFAVGGRAIMSGGQVHIGGGNALQKENGIEDTPDMVFADWTRPDDSNAVFNDRELVRAFADAGVDTYDFLVENGVKFQPTVAGPAFASTVPRQPTSMPWPDTSQLPVPGANGSGLMKALEGAARRKGVQILLQHKMTEVIREQQTSGRVLGVKVVEVDDWREPKLATFNIRAHKGVILCTGGISSNVDYRRTFDVRLTEEYQAHGYPLVQKDADGERAALAIGAQLWGTANQTQPGTLAFYRGVLGCQWNQVTPFPPESPVFFRARASGFPLSDFQNVILVKENGKRFYNEMAPRNDFKAIAAALAWTGDPNKLNGGGPQWAIFDADAVERASIPTEAPLVDYDGGFFFSADTIEELAAQIIANPYQWRAMPADALAETVERYNSFVDSGTDDDFGKPTPMFKIEKPPFYAAWATHISHDTLTGLRINTNAQVMNMHGEVIPALYAAGDTAGGFALHGLGRAIVFGRLGGIHAATANGA